MNPRPPLQHFRLDPAPFSRFPLLLGRGLLWLFLAQVILVCLGLTGLIHWRPGARWPEGVLLVLGAALLLASLAADLPVQNLIAIATLTMLISGAAYVFNAWISVPFGPCTYLRNAGQILFPPLPWSLPVLWVVVFLSARGVARRLLSPWRAFNGYGYWLTGLTVLLVVWFAFALEPFAHRRELWVWGSTKLPAACWYTAPVTAFFGWAVVGLLVVLFTSPFMLVKMPGSQHQKADPPLFVWGGLHLCLAISAAIGGDTPALIAAAVGGVAPVGLIAFTGWRPRRPGGATNQPKKAVGES